MPSSNPWDVLLKDPLSKETRVERKTLLGTSAIGIVIVKTGLVPAKISALGIDFTQADQRSLLRSIAAVIIYFLFAFLIYAGSDFVVWRLAFRKAVRQSMLERLERENKGVDPDYDFEKEVNKRISGVHVIFGIATPLSVLRAFFEFGLPVIIGIYAAITLLRTPP
jgi:hypothetical protein